MKISRIKDVEMNVVGMQGEWRQKKMLACRIEIFTIWKSNLFMKMIIEMPDEYRQGMTKKSAFHNLNNFQIYEKLMWAKEETSSKKDYIMQFVVATYYSFARVIGYMNPGKKTMYVNKRYFDNFSRKKVGSNGSHEYVHTLGGRHGGKFFRKSLEYWVNYVYETCYEHFFENDQTDIEYNVPDFDSTPVQVPTIPKPEPAKYRVECKRNWWSFWKKTCYRIYDV